MYLAFVDVSPEETLQSNPFESFKESSEKEASKDSQYQTHVRISPLVMTWLLLRLFPLFLQLTGIFVLKIIISDFIVKGFQNGAAFKPEFDAPRDFSSSSKWKSLGL